MSKQIDMFGEEAKAEKKSEAKSMPAIFPRLAHLDSYTVDQLKTLLKICGLKTRKTRKADLIKCLSAFPQENPDLYLGLLSEDEKYLLAEATFNISGVSAPEFTAKYKTDAPNMSLSDYYTYGMYKRDEENPPSPLLLVLITNRGICRICSELKTIFKTLLPKPKPVTLTTCDSIPENAELSLRTEKMNVPLYSFESESHALFESRNILRLAEAGKLKTTKCGRPTAAAVRAVDKCLVEPDFDLDFPEEERDRWYDEAGSVRAHAWPVLLQQAGLVKPKKNTLQLTPVGKAFLQSKDDDYWPKAVKRFIEDNDFDELNRINNIRGQSGYGKRYLSPTSIRKRCIEHALKKIPIGEWIEFDEFFRYFLALGETYHVSDDEWTLYFVEQEYGALAYNSGYDLEIQYMRAALMESFATLGIIDIAYTRPHSFWPEFSGMWGTDEMGFCSRYDGLHYIRLNKLGAWCLGLQDSWEPQKRDEQILTIQPNFEIIVSNVQKMTPAHRIILDAIAVNESEFVWQLERDAFLMAIENGRSGDEIMDFLQDHATNDMPETVRTAIESWITKADAVDSVEEATLIHFSDPHEALIAGHDSQIKKIARFVKPDSLVVPQKNKRALKTALRKLGIVVREL